MTSLISAHPALSRTMQGEDMLQADKVVAMLRRLAPQPSSRGRRLSKEFDVPAILFADICEKTERHHLKPVGRVPVPAEIASSDHFATATSRPTVASKTASVGAC
jgi:hypothetical protein